jgi:hypothetical protein
MLQKLRNRGKLPVLLARHHASGFKIYHSAMSVSKSDVLVASAIVNILRSSGLPPRSSIYLRPEIVMKSAKVPSTLNELLMWVETCPILGAIVHRSGCHVAVTLRCQDSAPIKVLPPYLHELHIRGKIPAHVTVTLIRLGLVSDPAQYANNLAHMLRMQG